MSGADTVRVDTAVEGAEDDRDWNKECYSMKHEDPKKQAFEDATGKEVREGRGVPYWKDEEPYCPACHTKMVKKSNGVFMHLGEVAACPALPPLWDTLHNITIKVIADMLRRGKLEEIVSKTIDYLPYDPDDVMTEKVFEGTSFFPDIRSHMTMFEVIVSSDMSKGKKHWYEEKKDEGFVLFVVHPFGGKVRPPFINRMSEHWLETGERDTSFLEDALRAQVMRKMPLHRKGKASKIEHLPASGDGTSRTVDYDGAAKARLDAAENKVEELQAKIEELQDKGKTGQKQYAKALADHSRYSFKVLRLRRAVG